MQNVNFTHLKMHQMNIYIRHSLLLLLFFWSVLTFSQESETNEFNCFSVLIGKDASQDGSVMLAHNEDDWGDRVVNWYKVPRQVQTFQNDSITFKRGHKIAQIPKTNSFLWLEIPELEFSDTYMNEHGIVVTSNACISREDKAEIEEGGIGYWLRRLIAERAKTALEAVILTGELVERIGYASSGRTYSIADANEIWMLSVVKGKHWIAQRVPDKEVAIIPNYYTISKVDLSDSDNFLGSEDLVDYAIARSWYNPEKEGEFNFRRAYSDQDNLKNLGNKARHWTSINALSQKQYVINDEFPFSFVPKKKLALPDVYKVLRNHYEETDFNSISADTNFNPHKQETMSVCSNTNQYGFVAQLRNWMPTDLGSVMWIAPRRPCSQSFIPIYAGITNLPKKLAKTDYTIALQDHFTPIEDFETYATGHDYIIFGSKAKKIDSNYNDLIRSSDKKNQSFEKKLLSKQDKFEKRMIKIYEKSPRKARSLTRFSKKNFKKLLKAAK